MAIQAIRANTVCHPAFTAKKQENAEYENPISRKTERNLAILGSVGVSSLIGVTAAGLTSCIAKQGLKNKWTAIVGLGAMALSLVLTLPSKLYNTKVNAFAKEKEMDVFSRKKEAQAGIYGGINEEVKDPEVPLNQKIEHYTTVAMADNGKGVMVKGA